MIIVAVSPNGPVAVVEQALRSKTDKALSANTVASDKLNKGASEQSLQTLLLVLILTLLSVFAFILIAYFWCRKQSRGLQQSNAIQRGTPNRVAFRSPAVKKMTLGRRVSPFAKQLFPVNALSMSPMPESNKKQVFVFDASRLLKARISSPL